MTGQEVQLLSIDKELKKLHATQAVNKEVRANLFTLILYVQEQKRTTFLEQMIQNIIEKFPCRIVFILAEKTFAATHFNLKVASAHSKKGGSLITCDQITIEVGAEYINRVPSLILPHILTDLPVYLLWGQDATSEHEILPKLEKLADRLIFDAECTQTLKKFSAAILEKKKTLSLDLVDINWALCSSWREKLTQAFYLPEHLEQLNIAQVITLNYNALHSDWVHLPEMQAIFIQAWLASRLKWTFADMYSQNDEKVFRYSHKRGQVQIKLIGHVQAQLQPGVITAFELLSHDNYHFHLETDVKATKVIVNCSSTDICELPFSLPLTNSTRGNTFMHEIFYAPPSQHYFDALELINQMN